MPDLPYGATKYVNLDRRFINHEDFADTDGAEHDALVASLLLGRTGDQYSWADLQALRCVVVLGEAQSGKSTEFKARAEQLAADGFAWFLELDEVAEGVADALESDDGFRQWQAGNARAWFFLDAADEAKLNRHTLHTCLMKLKLIIGTGAWERTHLLISCRASDWSQVRDGATVQRLFPSESAGLLPTTASPFVEDASSNPAGRTGQGIAATAGAVVLQMVPLDWTRVALLATWRLADGDAVEFLTALKQSDADVVATRPGDVLWLTDRWLQAGKLGALRELLEATVAEKLRERNGQRLSHETISSDRMRAGAERLAAATVLCRQVVLRRPSSDGGTDGIPVSIVLSDWAPRDAEDLLGRAVFDVTTLGRVRFHHRAVREYLAASWLKRILDAECPRSEIKSRLYAVAGERMIPIPSRGPLIAWLASMDDEFRDYVIDHSPMLLLQHGDPSSLSLTVRRRLLRRLLENASSSRRPTRPDDRAIARFAAPELAPDVEQALRSWPGDPPSELIELARIGRYNNCAPLLMELSCTPTADVVTRVLSVEALRELCEPDALREHLRRLFAPPALDPRVAAAAIEEFFPNLLDSEGAVAVLRELSPQPRVVAGPAWIVARHVIAAADRGQRRDFVTRLGDLVACDERHHWLVGCLGQVTVDLLKTASDGEDWAFLGAIFDALSSESPQRWFDLDTRDFRTALNDCPSAKRHLFWRTVGQLRALPDAERFTRWHQVRFDDREEIRFAQEDFDWLLLDAQGRADVVDRLLALDIILHVLGPSAETLVRVRESVANHPELSARLEPTHARRAQSEEYPEANRWARERTARDRRAAQISAANRSHLNEHLDDLRNGDFNLLWWLYQHAETTDGSSRWARSNVESIRQEFGDAIHDAAHDGFATHWSKYSPRLPHERPQRNSPENGLLVGLTGLALAYGKGMRSSTLSTDEAAVAARYACGEINGFPPWFEDLLEAHPVPVRAVLSLAMTADYSTPRDEPAPHDVLNTVAFSSAGIKIQCAPVVAELIDRPTAHPELLDQALKVLLDAGPLWQDWVRRRTLDVLRADTGIPTMKIWWPVLFRLEPARAAELLRQWLSAGQGLAAVRDACAVMLVAVSFQLDGADRDSLGLLATIAYEVIRPEDDAAHPAFSMRGPRDDAQMARSRLVNALAEKSGSSPLLARLAQDSVAAGEAEWLHDVALRRLAKDAEPESMDAAAARDLQLRFTTHPATASQLFEAVVARFSNIADDALNSMFSTRALFWPHECSPRRTQRVHEREVQKWLAHELRMRAHGAYSVDREPEEDDMNRPDIRVSRGGIGPVSIELKCADNWSLSELEQAVTHQLVAQYMRDATAKYGILVITRTDKDEWRTRRKRVNFAALVSCLQAVADASVRSEGLGGVRIVAIDFAPPLGSTAARLRAGA